MRNFNKFGPFGCGRIKAALRFSLNVSGCVLILTLGGRLSGSLGVLSNSDIVEIVSGVGRLWGSLGSRLVVGEAQAAICFCPIVWTRLIKCCPGIYPAGIVRIWDMFITL